jgi:hypothetical protein
MLGTDFMPSQVEQITDSSMCNQESLSLLDRFEPPHPSLPYTCSLMRLPLIT